MSARKIALIGGDGVGPEVVAVGARVLDAIRAGVYPSPSGNIGMHRVDVRDIAEAAQKLGPKLEEMIGDFAQKLDAWVVTAGEAPVAARSEPREAPPAALAAELPPGDPTLRIRPLEQVERELIEDAIAACDGNIPKAAALLEISASTIYRKRQAWADADAAHSA